MRRVRGVQRAWPSSRDGDARGRKPRDGGGFFTFLVARLNGPNLCIPWLPPLAVAIADTPARRLRSAFARDITSLSITNTPAHTFEMLSSVLSGLAFSPRAAEGPCDIYAAGGTPCVAAHSMVRALFGGYDGPLYLVQRASDLATNAVAEP